MAKNNYFTGQPIFSQLLSFIPSTLLRNCMKKHGSDRYYKKFKSRDHLITMLYSAFQRCTSLREVTTGLMACQQKLLHLGIFYVPRRSTLSDANRDRPSEFFASVYKGLYSHYFKSLPDSRFKKIENRLFIIDSTTISLFSEVMKGMGTCGVNGRKKGGAKAHMVVKSDEDLPCFTLITHATKNDKEIFHHFEPPKGAIIVMDKGYNSYIQLEQWDKKGVTFVTRLTETAYQQIESVQEVSEIEKQAGVLSDDVVVLGRPSNNKTQKITVRRIRFKDKLTGKEFAFITNNFHFKPSTIAEIYKKRWQIELLFKRLKQNYPLRYFLGETENAIKTQIWCALIADLLLKLIQEKLKKKWSFANIAGMIRLHLMNYLHLIKFLNDPEKTIHKYKEPPNLHGQLSIYLP